MVVLSDDRRGPQVSPSDRLLSNDETRQMKPAMPDLCFFPLDQRALLTLSGLDRVAFLQGLVSADVTHADGRHALYGALLTPQGKFLYDFFLAGIADDLVIEVETSGRAEFRQRLLRFKLRSKIALAEQDSWRVFALWGNNCQSRFGLPPEAGAMRPWPEGAAPAGVVMVDPRLPAAGLRAWLPCPEPLLEAGFRPVGQNDWDQHRILLGLADGRRDLIAEKTILLEAGFDELNGVDWQKGCFMGQEVTVRSKYRGQIKKRLLPVEIEGVPPAPGTVIYNGLSEAGEMRSHAGQIGLAILRLDSLAPDAILRAADARLLPRPPDWLKLG